MNKILQKRIEEAAIKVSDVCEPCDYGDPFCASCHRPYMYDAAKKMGEVILNNQWISVEEALPEENVFVFVRGENTLGTFFNSDYIGCNGDWYLLSNYGTVPDRKITHWMLIPTINNEEK